MKVTLVGISGSGKTAFLSGLNDTLGNGATATGFHIAPRAESFKEFVMGIGDLSQLGISHTFSFPEATQKTTLWPFTVWHHDTTVTYFDWIDYRGGILTDIYTAERNDEEIEELLGHIVASNAVIVLADSFTLTHFTNTREAQARSGARVINQLFEAFSRHYPDRDLIYVVALTKADIVKPEWKDRDFAELVERGMEVFAPLVRLTRRKASWTGGIVPVSAVGEGNVHREVTETGNPRSPIKTKDTIVAFPEPYNTDNVLFFCLCQILKQMKEEAVNTISQREAELEAVLKKAGRLNEFWSWVTGERSAREIAASIMTERRKDQEVLSAFQPYIAPLCDVAMEKVRIIK